MNPGVPAPAGGGTASPPTPATLVGSVEVSLRLPFSLRTDISLPVYTYNSVSQRYEPAGLSATPSPADPLATKSDTVKFSITAFGRYAVFSLLPLELPPPAPQNLRLLSASTQVRQLAWNAGGRRARRGLQPVPRRLEPGQRELWQGQRQCPADGDSDQR